MLDPKHWDKDPSAWWNDMEDTEREVLAAIKAANFAKQAKKIYGRIPTPDEFAQYPDIEQLAVDVGMHEYWGPGMSAQPGDFWLLGGMLGVIVY